MKRFFKLIASAICLSLVFFLASCTDLGAGESTDALGEYFSKVYVLSENGSKEYSISHFNDDIDLEDIDIPVVVPYEEYCYIGFRVADGYTISLSEFAFFARTESESAVLELEFYTVDKMPTSLKDSSGNDVVISPSDGEGSSGAQTGSDTGSGADEGSDNTDEEDLFSSENRFHSASFSISEEWNSVLLQFNGEKTVKGGEYVIVRIKNNCFSALGDEAYEPIAFTFNYLLFYINSAHK